MTQRSASYTRRWAVQAMLVLAVTSIATATVHAATVDAARSAASTFALTLEAQDTTRAEHDMLDFTRRGTFSSRAPFCTTGTFVQVAPLHWTSTGDRMTWRFTCDDGTGDLAFSIPSGWYSSAPVWNSDWRLLGGSGIYASLRGQGSLQGERLGAAYTDQWTLAETWRSTFNGFIDRDAVAPTVDMRSLTTKLRHAAGAYSIKIALTLHDDVEGNPVRYTLSASSGGLELARRAGTATTGELARTLRVRPPAAARTVRLRLTGEDPVGNEASVSRVLRLPH